MMNIVRFLLMFWLLLLGANQALATDVQDITQRIQDFQQSEQARFVPDGLKRLSAYQGAMMLALDSGESGFTDPYNQEKVKISLQLQQAIDKANDVLVEVQSNAKIFVTLFADVLYIEAQAHKAYAYHHAPQTVAHVDVATTYEVANQHLKQTIISAELGNLNQARRSSKLAESAFTQSIDAAMSGLVEQTSRAISYASSTGAKRYTPHLWSITRAEFGLLKRYHENQLLDADEKTLIQRPSQPGYAFEMAVYMQKLAIQVKEWRRDMGSHEKMAQQARQHRLALAKALALPLNYAQVGVDIDAKVLLQQVKNLRQTLLAERQTYLLQTTENHDKNEVLLRDALYQQRLADQQAFQVKVKTLKTSFHVKLEQETFDKKRKEKVSALFANNEVEILSNLDGSLLIRAKKIQFSSGSSKLGGQYFDFLGRLKEALLMYPDRQIRIEGHTDNLGGAKENRRLSLKRAESVQSFLIASDMDVQRLRALGYGDVKPIVSNDYKKGRAMNRRIDIIIEAAHDG